MADTVKITERTLPSRPGAFSSGASRRPEEYGVITPPTDVVSAAEGVFVCHPRVAFRPLELGVIPGVGTLKKALLVAIEKGPGGVVLSAPDLDITESGVSVEEALEAFCEFFRDDLEHWRSADDRSLTEDARALKGRFLEYVQ